MKIKHALQQIMFVKKLTVDEVKLAIAKLKKDN
jgi:hypothetical protein